MEKVAMTPEVARKLREPFSPEHVGKLPRIWCRACREAAKRGGACNDHRKARCQGCNNNITTAHLHLDYVGHAETTDRFLAVDPEWNWEPVAFDVNGLPAIDQHGGLWIRLTVAGVTRLGYGHADGKSGPDAIKEAIGDALRNAGMRFGVGLDLWGARFKQDEHSDTGSEAEAGAWESATPAKPTDAQAEVFTDLARHIAAAETEDRLRTLWTSVGEAFKADRLSAGQANDLRSAINERVPEIRAEQAEAAPGTAATEGPSDAEHRRMHALWIRLGLGGDEQQWDRLVQTAGIIGREVTSSKELRPADVAKVLRVLEQRVAEQQRNGAEVAA